MLPIEPPTDDLPPAAVLQTWVTVDHAAQLANVSRRTIYNWLERGLIRACRNAGGHLRIDPTSLYLPGDV